jgi:tRNA pseudouridine55 synthase
MRAESITAYKNLGETPLEALERVRIERNIGADVPMTYAGRLDPMAEGVMIILMGEECKKKEEYLGLDKTYLFEVLVGFQTDTYDLLGLVKSENEGLRTVWPSFQKNLARRSEDLSNSLFSDETLNSFIGTFIQKYPSFSSKTVGGKQLFQLSKDDELPDEMPEHEVTITKLSCTSTEVREKEELQKEILRRIGLVKGDFRQKEITEKWNEAFKNSNEKEFTIFKCICECSSGTYIRQLVADISEKLGIPLVTYSIKRTRVGEYRQP